MEASPHSFQLLELLRVKEENKIQKAHQKVFKRLLVDKLQKYKKHVRKSHKNALRR